MSPTTTTEVIAAQSDAGRRMSRVPGRHFAPTLAPAAADEQFLWTARRPRDRSAVASRLGARGMNAPAELHEARRRVVQVRAAVAASSVPACVFFSAAPKAAMSTSNFSTIVCALALGPPETPILLPQAVQYRGPPSGRLSTRSRTTPACQSRMSARFGTPQAETTIAPFYTYEVALTTTR
jgi:hypothetical protein